jgi:hypothetical protein
MKDLIIISVVMVAAVIFAVPQSQSQQKVPETEGGTGAQDKALFLHLLAPRAYTDPPLPAHRIVTARVYPFQDFSISVGDTRELFAKPWDGAWTNARWSKDGSPESRPLEPLWNSGDATLAGRIEQVDGRFVAHLQGLNGTTMNYFHGEIEIDKPVHEQGGYYHGRTILGVWFALSTNPDCSRFLRALDDGSLQKGNIVDQNSAILIVDMALPLFLCFATKIPPLKWRK